MRIIISCMDTQKSKLGKHGDILAVLTDRKVVVGAKQLRKAVKAGNARQVYLAKNADPAITEPIEAMCKENSIEYTWVKSMIDLGHVCGIEVGAAVATIIA